MLANSLTSRLFWLFLTIYVALGMHFFMHNQGGAGLYLPFNMIGWVFISLLIGVGLWHLTSEREVTFTRSMVWYAAGFFVLLLPFFNPDGEWSSLAQPRFFGIAAGLLLFFALWQFQLSQKQRHKVLYLLLCAVAIEALLGLVQFLFLKEGNWLGYNVNVNRPYGIFQKDNVFASFMAVGIAISLYLLRWDEFITRSGWRIALLSFVLLSSSFLLVQVQSRAGTYGAILAVICLLPILWCHNRRLFIWASLILITGVLAGSYFYHPARSAESYVLTTGYRQLYWRHVLSMFSQTPWLGHGYGSFEYTFLHDYYDPARYKTGMTLIEENLDHPHNEILFWLHEGGIAAIAGLVLFITGYIHSLLKSDGWAKRISLLALIMPLLFHSMVEYPFYHSVAHFFFFIVLIWFADAEGNSQQVYPCQYWFLARLMAIAIPLIVVPFMLTGIQEAYVLTKYDRAKDKNPQVLEQIINPLPWMMMYEFQMRSAQLTFSAVMHDKAGLDSYVDWAKQFLHNTPRAIVYARLVYAFELLNDKQQAQYWLDEGKRLFPQADFLQKIPLSSKPVVSGAK